ncbi:MAG TPA: hypothetical protein VGL15_07640 [Vicinamibacteria bacterium]
MPAVGMEAEFSVWVDGERVKPETYWKDPTAFIRQPMMKRSGSSSQLPTGGAVYFDAGVVEVVTPLIELAPGCTARVVRSLWEQIEFLREQLDRWESRSGHRARLEGWSAHYNVSFEGSPADRGRAVDKLALLLAYALPLPVALLGGNRRSTGVGVRPRQNRIEVTGDFTPDPGLTIATASFIVGVVRAMEGWPSYEKAMLDARRVGVVDGVMPGKHTSRRGWLLRDYHLPRSPFTCNVDARVWPTRDGRTISLRALAREQAWLFRHWIRRYADAFSVRLLFGVLEGQSPSLLELPDRPGAYEDVGRACRWGQVLPELQAVPRDGRWTLPPEASWSSGSFERHVARRERERHAHHRRQEREAKRAGGGRPRWALRPPPAPIAGDPGVVANEPESSGYRGGDRRVGPPDDIGGKEPAVNRRRRPRVLERRIQTLPPRPTPFPDRFLSRSAYERVFLNLVSGRRLVEGGKSYTPTGMRGWYHAVFRRDADGHEQVFSIDELIGRKRNWRRP